VCKVLTVRELQSRDPHCKDNILDAGAEVEVFAVTHQDGTACARVEGSCAPTRAADVFGELYPFMAT
jgi:hypothetical protein